MEDNSRLHPLVIAPNVPQNNEHNALQYQGFIPHQQNPARFAPTMNQSNMLIGKQHTAIQNNGAFNLGQMNSNLQGAYSYGMQQNSHRFNEFNPMNPLSAMTQTQYPLQDKQISYNNRNATNQYSSYRQPIPSTNVNTVNHGTYNRLLLPKPSNISFNHTHRLLLPKSSNISLNPTQVSQRQVLNPTGMSIRNSCNEQSKIFNAHNIPSIQNSRLSNTLDGIHKDVARLSKTQINSNCMRGIDSHKTSTYGLQSSQIISRQSNNAVVQEITNVQNILESNRNVQTSIINNTQSAGKHNETSVPYTTECRSKIQTPVQNVNLKNIASSHNRKIEQENTNLQNILESNRNIINSAQSTVKPNEIGALHTSECRSSEIQTPLQNMVENINLKNNVDSKNRKIETPPSLQNNKGKFNWIVIEGVKMPSVLYEEYNYLVVRLLEDKILAYFPSEMPEEIQTLPPLNSIPLQPEHIELFNAINDHYDLDFKVYSSDLLVKCSDFIKFYNVVKKAFPESVASIRQRSVNVKSDVAVKPKNTSPNSSAASSNNGKKDLPQKAIDSEDKSLVENNTNYAKNDTLQKTTDVGEESSIVENNTIQSTDEKGWVQLNNTILPFLYVQQIPYVPLPIIQSAAQLPISEKFSVLLDKIECKILNDMVSVINNKIKFMHETTRFVSLTKVLEENKGNIKFIKYLPGKEPKKEAVFFNKRKTKISDSKDPKNAQVNSKTSEISSSSILSDPAMPVISNSLTMLEDDNDKPETEITKIATEYKRSPNDIGVSEKLSEKTPLKTTPENVDNIKSINNNTQESMATQDSLMNKPLSTIGHSANGQSSKNTDGDKCINIINNNICESSITGLSRADPGHTIETNARSCNRMVTEEGEATSSTESNSVHQFIKDNSNKKSPDVKTVLQNIKRISFNGKTFLTMIRDGKSYILLEAISRVFFPCVPLQNFLDSVHVTCGTEHIVECTNIEENSFKTMYCISGKLICNKLIEASMIEPNMTVLEEMFEVIETGNNENILKRKINSSLSCPNPQKRNCVNDIICL